MSGRGRSGGTGGNTKHNNSHNPGSNSRGGSGRGGGQNHSSGSGGGQNHSSGRGGGQNKSSGRGRGSSQSSDRGGGDNSHSSRGGGHSHNSGSGSGNNHSSSRGGGLNPGQGNNHSHSSGHRGSHSHGSGNAHGHNQSATASHGSGHSRGGGRSHGGGHCHGGAHSSGNTHKTGNVKNVLSDKSGIQKKSDNKNQKDSRGSKSQPSFNAKPYTFNSPSGSQHKGCSSEPVKHIIVQKVVHICPPPVVHFPQYQGHPHISANPPYNPPVNRPSAPPPNYDHYPAPPPSYDEAVEEQPPKSQSSNTKLTADTLVKTLALFNGQFGTVESLARQAEVDFFEIISLAKSRGDLFALMGEGKDTVIEFVPKIALCSGYFSNDGCNDYKSCEELHICKTYVNEFCKMPSCQFGHRWDTAHNTAILSKYYLDLINPKTLHQVVKKVCKDNSKLQVCFFYNSERGCRYDEKCWQLHICKNFVLGKCSNQGCSLNHNILTHQCSKVLKSSGVSVNETPRDVLKHVISIMDIQMERNVANFGLNKTKCQDKQTKEEEPKKVNRGIEKQCNEKSLDGNSDSEFSDGSQITNEESLPGKEKNKSSKFQNKLRTIKSTDVFGDVEIPEICIFSIDDKCKNFKKGCKFLHSKSLFHWQVEMKGKWYNLRTFQSKALETAYRDIAKYTVQVPALEEIKLEESAKELLNVLGTSPWNADLRTMTMTSNEQQSKIRRVSTKSSVISSNPKATVFAWYFQDLKQNWIQYGQVDSLGKEELVFNITSEDIEKEYLRDPSSSMFISNAFYKYTLDFSTMVQKNGDTGDESEIRRRPSRLLYQKKSAAEDTFISTLPTHWTPMTSGQTHLLIPVVTESSEFMDVSSKLRIALPRATIVNMKRLQNPYLWQLFQNKKTLLSERYDDHQLNIQKLFHGTDPKYIDSICKENIDWRQGITFDQTWGKGTYFSNSPAEVRAHCTPNEYGRLFVLIAHVIVGMVVEGNDSSTCPPVNPATCAPFDTTVDDTSAPKIFVKYEKEEYYPEYIIEFY